MMGMTELPYWASWYTHYTLVNTVVSFSVWLALMTLVLENSSPSLTFVFIWAYGQSLFGLVMIGQSLFDSPRLAGVLTSLSYLGAGTLVRIFSDGN